MHRFALIEHTSDPAAVWFVGKVGQDIDGFEHAPVFLQTTMYEVLVVEGLQLGREQHRRHRAIFEGRRNAMHIVPAAHNQVPLDRLPTKERLQDSILADTLDGVEALICEVTDAWREL